MLCFSTFAEFSVYPKPISQLRDKAKRNGKGRVLNALCSIADSLKRMLDLFTCYDLLLMGYLITEIERLNSYSPFTRCNAVVVNVPSLYN